MLANVLTLTDEVPADHDYDLISREGMNSIRRDKSIASRLAHSLVIKNQINLNAEKQDNRHLVQLNWKEEDASTGALLPNSVYLVIARNKLSSDSVLLSKVTMLAGLMTQAGFLDDILVGGN